MLQSVSLKSTIKHIVCDFNINNSNTVEDDENLNWQDLVMKCIEGRQQKVFSKIPEFSFSESENSMIPDENLFQDREIGRDRNLSTNFNQIIMEDIPLKTTPRSSLARQNTLPTTLIEEIASPSSPCASHSSPVMSPISSSIGRMPSVHSPAPSSAAPSPNHSPVPSFTAPSPGHSSTSSLSIPSANHSPVPSFTVPSPNQSPVPSSAAPSPDHSPAPSLVAPSPDHSPTPFTSPTRPSPETIKRPKRFLASRRLQTWRGEHPIYIPMENGCYKVVGTTKPYTPDHLKRKKIIRKNKPKRILAAAATTIDEPSLSNSFIEASESTKEKLSKMFHSRDALSWKKSKFNEKIEHATLIRSKEANQLVGYLRFSGACKKQPQKTSSVTLFVLMKGSVSLKIDDESPVLLKELDPVIIPEATPYSMENLLDSESILLFTIL